MSPLTAYEIVQSVSTKGLFLSKFQMFTTPKAGPKKDLLIMAFRIALTLDVQNELFGRPMSLPLAEGGPFTWVRPWKELVKSCLDLAISSYNMVPFIGTVVIDS